MYLKNKLIHLFMKSFTQILLNSVVLLHTTTLLAQAENRLEAVGYRLEEEGNQTANYNMQTVVNKKTALLPGNLPFQIGQRVGPTMNYELPTVTTPCVVT